MIYLNEITKKYNDNIALNEISLKLEKGKIYGLIGPNGAGKTTLLKLLSGVLLPTNGNIIFDKVIFEPENYIIKNKIGFIPDQPDIFPYLKGIEFLELVRTIYKMDYQIFKKNIEYYIDYFDMNNYINSLINSYSHGMRQKLMLTSAFIHNPEYLFVDEPIVGLDPMTIKLLVNELKRLSTENKIILVSSHILDIVKKICSDIILIDKGRIVFSGEAHDADFKKHLKQIFGDLT